MAEEDGDKKDDKKKDAKKKPAKKDAKKKPAKKKAAKKKKPAKKCKGKKCPSPPKPKPKHEKVSALDVAKIDKKTAKGGLKHTKAISIKQMKENIYKQMDKVRPQPISRAPEIKEMKKVKLAKGDLKPTSAIRVHIPQKEKAKLQAKEKVVNTIPDKYAMMPADSLDALNLLKKKEADKKKAQKKKLKKIDK